MPTIQQRDRIKKDLPMKMLWPSVIFLHNMMLAFVLLLTSMVAQGVPVLPNQGGTVTGVLTSPTGEPVTGVRVFALTRPEGTKDPATKSSAVSLVETDAAGRFRLDNIPPGRYYISAGRVDFPTFYPGTLDVTEGTLITVAAGETTSAIDFVLNNASVRRDYSVAGVVVGLQVSVENGGEIPVSSALRFERSQRTLMEVPITVPNVTLPAPEYHILVESLPDGYSVKSLTLGSWDVKGKTITADITAKATALNPAIVLVLTPPADANH
jgi:hypothetical protein